MAVEAAFIVGSGLVYSAFAIVFVVGIILAYFVISLIGAS
jgi:hypothetical protein